MDNHLWVSWAALQAVLQLFPIFLGMLFSCLGVGLMLGVAIQAIHSLGEVTCRLSIILAWLIIDGCVHVMRLLILKYDTTRTTQGDDPTREAPGDPGNAGAW